LASRDPPPFDDLFFSFSIRRPALFLSVVITPGSRRKTSFAAFFPQVGLGAPFLPSPRQFTVLLPILARRRDPPFSLINLIPLSPLSSSLGYPESPFSKMLPSPGGPHLLPQSRSTLYPPPLRLPECALEFSPPSPFPLLPAIFHSPLPCAPLCVVVTLCLRLTATSF